MPSLPMFSRRHFLRASGLAIASAGLAGCTSSMNTDRFRQETMPVFRNPALEGRWVEPAGDLLEGPMPTGLPPQDAYYGEIYAAKEDGGILIPAVPYRQIDPRLYRQEVSDPFGEAPGTIVVDTADRYLYHIQQGGRATRYGVGLGREGFAWSGRGVIQWKQMWPKWTPPESMIARQPILAKYSADNGGMPGGLDNPLGARALYIFQNGQDTLYRVHGTPEWQSIGKAVSSGCVRMLNQDVIDLYGRVRGKAPILVV
ncbi:lipoprotein-anchoring transpeptidase ErfK/SrfK [Sinorhizobium kostiense]|uniref:Lipoprotein-anchoring transpeptidase ErfK/SrfK n=1 Tax=Sinorhizobium kostiense TaxID=76747 RepID=A0ABS4R031_9HYPH|nr:L,D-transpeptidase family protein [Sinorhizobium kostiense]MBP2235202.1 lipoprotein-anchoring transpeptidase ErfK/SrfK [Sinorhizobium kostiense]